jgi:transcriptional regulator with XRE-family HTH domain
MRHPIRRYCEAHDLTQRAFSDLVGLSEGFISQLINGREVCGRKAALLIREKTAGAIGLDELLSWESDAAA